MRVSAINYGEAPTALCLSSSVIEKIAIADLTLGVLGSVAIVKVRLQASDTLP